MRRPISPIASRPCSPNPIPGTACRSSSSTTAPRMEPPASWRPSARRDPDRLTVVAIAETPPGMSPKKHALSQGMKVARGEIILTTDADCLMGPDWVASLVREFDERNGHGPGHDQLLSPWAQDGAGAKPPALSGAPRPWSSSPTASWPPPWWASASRCTAMPTISPTVARCTTWPPASTAMGISSAATTTSSSRPSIPSDPGTSAMPCRPSSQVQTEPPLSLRQFWEQRKRWASKCSFYQPKQAAFLAGIFLYYALILCFLVVGAAYWPPVPGRAGKLRHQDRPGLWRDAPGAQPVREAGIAAAFPDRRR